MLKSFKNFKEENIKEIFVTFGRYNPPTTGHGKLFAALAKAARGNTFRIYASHKSHPKTDPLEYKDKIRFLRKMFPEYGRNIILDKAVKTVLDAASAAYRDGYTKFTLVVGADRIKEFKALLEKYNGKGTARAYYEFKHGIDIISAGARDPDSEGVTGMSASKLRAAATENDLKAFTLGMPTGFRGVLELFNAVREGMGLEKSESFRKTVELETSELREKYIAGKIFQVDTIVRSLKNGLFYKITECHNNYVSAVALDNNSTKKFFIEDIEEFIEEYNEDYYKDLSKSTSSKRSAQFNKQASMSDSNPRAYKPAPGDARAKTKPSKYTKAYHAKYGKDEGYDYGSDELADLYRATTPGQTVTESGVESALKKKSEESGISYDILKKVFDRGMAAWRSGHRPGATQHQWAYARVNSFIMGGKTQKTTDSDLWTKHKGK